MILFMLDLHNSLVVVEEEEVVLLSHDDFGDEHLLQGEVTLVIFFSVDGCMLLV